MLAQHRMLPWFFFQGIQTSFTGKPYIFVIFRGGGGGGGGGGGVSGPPIPPLNPHMVSMCERITRNTQS